MDKGDYVLWKVLVVGDKEDKGHLFLMKYKH